MAIPRLDMVMKAELSELPPLLAALERFTAASDIPEDAALKIELAIDELVNNVIDHGYAPGEAGEIRISVARHARGVTIEFSDDARLFDPFSAPEPDIAADIETRQPRGLGIHLVRTLMTESGYSVERQHNLIRLGLALDDPP